MKTLLDFNGTAPGSNLRGPMVPEPSRSVPGKVWPTYPNEPYCACWPFSKSGDCIHVQRSRNKLYLQASEYFTTRVEKEIAARFGSFEEFYDWAWHGTGEPETVYLCNLFLALLYCQRTRTGTTDLIHYAVNEQFTGDARKCAVVTRKLSALGYIEFTGIKVKSSRKINHGSVKRIYRLTKRGARLVEGGGAQ